MRDGEREPVVVIPLVAEVIVVRVQPAVIAAAVRVEEIRIAIGIARGITNATIP